MSTPQDLMGLGLPPALASRLGYQPATVAGVGTTQTGAALIATALTLAGPTSSNTAFVLSNALSTGRPVFVWNTSATLTALVFPPSGGKINGGSTNAAVSLPPGYGAMFQLQNGAGVAAETWGAIVANGAGFGYQTESVTTGITASTTHTLVGATPLTTQINYVSTCANASDAVALPSASAAMVGVAIVVFNAGAAAAAVWPQTSDTIDGGSAGVAVTLTNAKRCIYFCMAVNTWISAQLGVASA